ncbi:MULTISPECIES: nickel-responsive transcriptional regulator NikR [Methanosarcina]|jgi:CopG family nickel-responsive transcriptional regulator|uniref:Putative nickel-responsive regulator 1 n=7 Tax=Methanosarcina mazei TaxID=2209 RepID=NIKR1_METMA|nr:MULTISPECIES: nickel-responsive transcriptional regulator NikR [Methanosarcina]Q8PZ28.1 RecName: Full=Putative nickel-responsive regulator 1 [Methanosarcina mazei Go1]AAM30362.1 putative nickel-responsive regulator NikR [Methanosarcina mazei Go1]AGF96090.1 Nickel responsive regulator NikR [Methanosarcina mazei Tuc01]AKB60612.1 Nickel responsive regulator NikR [Methanosarcina mazei SarPi]AKB63843.1 Nickel responsive regulator NikR [Methanosarcina mazei S-6]AKB67321.1 Nickel responsive regul
METELMRIGVSLPDTLLGKFDEIIEKRGYSSRSEAIRDSIRSYISYNEWMGNIKGHHVGTIVIIYDHTQRGLSNVLTDIQHHYSHLIRSSIHIYPDREDCFEIVVLEGEGKEITELAEAIMALKGVKLSKLITTESNETDEPSIVI